MASRSTQSEVMPIFFAYKWLFLGAFLTKLRGIVKKRIFYGQADRRGGRGGGVSAPLALIASKCENFDPFFSMEYYSMILKTHLILL